ncbi:PAS domain-containing protein [Streptomyces hoynatensis]|uniref:PAS domain-containing protein n=2 Tax=Streptomyces hoynatensis TaxID=1141874 RepID=A0A3A9Z126_9ACTN|nr:PAS domain-containing protein [Streptomyces hoynatensis]
MDAALFAVDVTGRITHWNGQAERLLGWPREQVVGRQGLGGWAVREADAPEVLDRLLSVLRPLQGLSAHMPAIEGAVRQAQEFPLLRQDGGRVLVRAQTTAIRGADGRPTGVYCAFSEVHAQLDLERNLALSEALLKDSSWAVVVVDADQRAVAVNDRAADALAVSPVDMLGEPLGEFFGPGLEELESAVEHALIGRAPEEPVELWVTLQDDGAREEPIGIGRSRPAAARRCLLSGFLQLGSPLASDAAPLGVAWIFQDVTRARQQAQEAARQRFRDSQLSRAARAAADCEDPFDAAVLHLHYALAGFADHALLDVTAGARLVRIAETPAGFGAATPTRGVPVRYRPGHPAPQALERGVPVRATGGVSRSGWAVEHRWPKEAEHALCVVLRSRGCNLGVLTFLRGASRRAFDRADAAYGQDVALRVASALDLAGLGDPCGPHA